MNQKQKEDALFGEMVDIEYEIADQLRTLIHAEWDSNTVKSKLEKLMKDFDKINEEIEELEMTS